MVILSSFLAIFLVVGIILGVLLIRVTQQIKRVTTSAEHSVERTISSVNGALLSTVVAKIFTQQLNKRRKRKD